MKVKKSNRCFHNIVKTVLCMLFVCTLVVGMLIPVKVMAAPDDTDSSIKEVLEDSEPRLIVDSYEIVKGERSKGERFTIKINVRNTNQYADAYNVLVTDRKSVV